MNFKQTAMTNQTDKWKYAKAYEEILHGKKIKKILEFGIMGGASLGLWRELYPDAEITAVDSQVSRYAKIPAGVRVFEGRQEDAHILSEVTRLGPYDLIVDDAGHVPAHQRVTYDAMKDQATIYVIEDVRPQDAGAWPDGKTVYDSEATDEKFIVL